MRKVIYKTAFQRPNGVVSINVRPFDSANEAQAECDKNNKVNSHLGHHYVIRFNQTNQHQQQGV